MISKDYLYTTLWSDINNVKLTPGSLYLYAHDPEERSEYCALGLKGKNKNTTFVELSLNKQDQAVVIESNEVISLSSKNAILEFIHHYNPSSIYLEVTGMSCRLVAPLLRCIIEQGIELQVVYSEPKEYRLPEFKKLGVNKDLSEAVDGINPLPGFVTLANYREEPLFVVMLGFEGGRFHYLVSNKQPSYDRIRPVVGIPGYRIDYPYESYWGNKYSLEGTRAWEHVTYAEANSIVDSYLMLGKIAYDNRNLPMIIAPIGTKPHVIGAILYAIKHPTKVEILYDNPKRNVHRTDGIGRVLVCNVTKLFNEN